VGKDTFKEGKTKGKIIQEEKGKRNQEMKVLIIANSMQ